MSMISLQRTRSLAFLQTEWIPMLAGCTSASIPLSQVVRGRPRGLLQSLVRCVEKRHEMQNTNRLRVCVWETCTTVQAFGCQTSINQYAFLYVKYSDGPNCYLLYVASWCECATSYRILSYRDCERTPPRAIRITSTQPRPTRR